MSISSGSGNHRGSRQRDVKGSPLVIVEFVDGMA
jgi:hypothetical protein